MLHTIGECICGIQKKCAAELRQARYLFNLCQIKLLTNKNNTK